jgi:putative hydrolase of the HAD superfamily
MNELKKINSVVVFDLDDTLYHEYDYQTSGIKAVAKELKHLYNKDILDTLLEWRDQGNKDIFGKVCSLLQLPYEVKHALVWMYRLHDPDISLDEEVEKTLQMLKKKVKKIMILTDGRSISQRKKLKALGLNDIEVFISEEYHSKKPNADRFHIIMNNFPADTFYYIGDNPKNDFIAPNTLGWITVGIRQDKSIHDQSCEGTGAMASPSIWINSINELEKFL